MQTTCKTHANGVLKHASKMLIHANNVFKSVTITNSSTKCKTY